MNGTSRGFTLLELLVVIGIVALLAVLVTPAVSRIGARSRSTACVSNLRQLGVALNLYLTEHDNAMPVMESGRRSRDEEVPVIDNTLSSYLQDSAVFACPADDQGLAARTGTSYFWNSALNGQPLASLNFLTLEDPGRIPLLFDKDSFHPFEDSRVNILFADGHATRDLRFFVGN